MAMSSQREIFLSLPRSSGDLAGVFEHDGRVGYLYLLDVHGAEGQRVLAAIEVVDASQSLQGGEVGLLWSETEQLVGIMIRGRLCAAIEGETGRSFGGGYGTSHPPPLPKWVEEAFAG